MSSGSDADDSRARLPVPQAVRELVRCGPAGRLIEAEFEGQRFPWGLYEQRDHAAFAIVTCRDPNFVGGRLVRLVHQWRPADAYSIELPGGGAGLSEDEIIGGLLKEVRQEAGDLKILTKKRIRNAPFHNVAREVVPTGGGKRAHFFHLEVETPANLDFHYSEDVSGRMVSRWYTEAEVRLMVAEGKILDIILLFGLLMTMIVSPRIIGWDEL